VLDHDIGRGLREGQSRKKYNREHEKADSSSRHELLRRQTPKQLYPKAFLGLRDLLFRFGETETLHPGKDKSVQLLDNARDGEQAQVAERSVHKAVPHKLHALPQKGYKTILGGIFLLGPA
jgi:hypothetical protein